MNYHINGSSLIMPHEPDNMKCYHCMFYGTLKQLERHWDESHNHNNRKGSET